MTVTIYKPSFDSTEDPRFLTSTTLNIDGFDCTVYESQTIVSRDSLTIYKAEVRAVKNIHNDLLYEYLKENIQRLHSQIVMGSNPFKVISGDYTFVARKVTLTIGIDSFAIFFDGMLCQPMPSDTL
jgi:hypothetical protein